jgi:hypothetical protein
METSRLTVAVVIAVVVLGCSVLFVWAMAKPGDTRSGSLKVAVGQQSVEWKIEKNELSFKQILDFIFAKPAEVPEGQALTIEGQALIIDAIERLDYHHPVSLKIRALQGRSKGPFAVHFTPVKVSSSTRPPIPEGSAAVCPDHEFFRANLVLLNKERKNAVKVTASELLLCGGNGVLVTQVQLNPADARRLFGDSPLDRDEDAFAWA